MSKKPPNETPPIQPSLHLPVDHHTLEGEIINGKYRLKKAIAKGGMGVIYVADQLVLEREVAIKLVLQQADPIAEKRFLQEASLAAKIDHPNVPVLYDIKEFTRTKEKEFNSDVETLTKTKWVSLVEQNPKFIERPILFNKTKAIVGRPPEDLLKF